MRAGLLGRAAASPGAGLSLPRGRAAGRRRSCERQGRLVSKRYSVWHLLRSGKGAPIGEGATQRREGPVGCDEPLLDFGIAGSPPNDARGERIPLALLARQACSWGSGATMWPLITIAGCEHPPHTPRTRIDVQQHGLDDEAVVVVEVEVRAVAIHTAERGSGATGNRPALLCPCNSASRNYATPAYPSPLYHCSCWRSA